MGSLAWLGYGESKTYYHTIAELRRCRVRALHQRIRIGGTVEPGSIRRAPGVSILCRIGEGKQLPVSYIGSDPLPDTFIDKSQALVEGARDRTDNSSPNTCKPSAPLSTKPHRTDRRRRVDLARRRHQVKRVPAPAPCSAVQHSCEIFSLRVRRRKWGISWMYSDRLRWFWRLFARSYAFVGGISAIRTRHPLLVKSARQAGLATCGLIFLATFSLDISCSSATIFQRLCGCAQQSRSVDVL